jgi:hypothetical protein
VKGDDLEFAGCAAYEFWRHVVQHAGAEFKFSFNCVWFPGIRGHIEDYLTTHPTKHHDEVNQFAGKVCEQLGHLYNGQGADCPCCNCGWFAPWSDSVLDSRDAGQQLLFAYLEKPLRHDQPQLFCAFDQKYYFVGTAQKVELEWAQNYMNLVVKPVDKKKFTELCAQPLQQAKHELEVDLKMAQHAKNDLEENLRQVQDQQKVMKLEREDMRKRLIEIEELTMNAAHMEALLQTNLAEIHMRKSPNENRGRYCGRLLCAAWCVLLISSTSLPRPAIAITLISAAATFARKTS